MTAPKHLSVESKRLWEKISESYDITEESGLVLRVAFENFDLSQRARRERKKSKSMMLGDKVHPLIAVEKQAYGLFLRAWGQSGIGLEVLGEVGAPVKPL